MSKNWVVVPTCLPMVLRRCHRCASGRFRLLDLPYDNDPCMAARLLQGPVVRRRDVGGSARTERPAWQSPYGPPPYRAHRGRWAPVPGVAWSRSVLRRGHLCDRCV
ncbi:hypothetical protein PV364_16945 [Streptomyces sp. MI02-7b]|nr:hypothetical protein [Streptomyces sp. MI02-7b]